MIAARTQLPKDLLHLPGAVGLAGMGPGRNQDALFPPPERQNRDVKAAQRLAQRRPFEGHVVFVGRLFYLRYCLQELGVCVWDAVRELHLLILFIVVLEG